MYIPAKFKEEDQSEIDAFIQQHPFGLLLTVDGDEIHDTHTPFILSKNNGCIYGHIARANPQWNHWNDDTTVTAKVIFTGPHTYISPHDYVSDFNVPTWNYTVASVSGELVIIDDEADILEFLDQLVSESESSENAWKLDHSDERYTKLISGIVVFKVKISKVEASFKLNQNKTAKDQQGVIGSLEKRTCPFDHAVAQMMKNNLESCQKK